jgi:hypothetical protein
MQIFKILKMKNGAARTRGGSEDSSLLCADRHPPPLKFREGFV